MIRYVAVAALLLAGCGQNGTARPRSSVATSGSSGTGAAGAGGAASTTGGSATGTTAATTSTTTSTTSATTTTGAGSVGSTGSGSGSGSGGNCIPDNAFQGTGVCCSGRVDASGYCAPAVASSSTAGTGTSGTSGTTSTSSTATGTTTGGTCPTNLPNLSSGQTQSGGPCNNNPSSPPCAKGFACEAGQCVLNRSNALQITLSFDDSEDFDLHVLEPLPDGGECEIYYAAPDPVPAYDGGFPFPFDAGFGGFGGFDAGFPIPQAAICSKGWLDRDSNAACRLDNVNIENVLYPNNQPPPRGHYKVRVDYWQDCDGKAASNYAVQVLRGGVVTTTCATQTSSQANGGGRGSGVLTTEFDIP